MTTVSLCVVARNEENFLPKILSDIKNQTYPRELMQIVLVDGMSDDGTRAVMERFQAESGDFASVVVADNTKKIQASGWNVAIANSTGDVIIRIDAHAHITPEFVEKNARTLEGGETVCGGLRPCIAEDGSPWKRTLVQTENSTFGSNVSKSRRGGGATYVNSVFHGAYRREAFERAGGFNEELYRTEDNDMNYRIRKSGIKIRFDPDIVSYQYARGTLSGMIKQKYGNGKWVGLTMGVQPKCLSPFHLIPFAFVMGIAATTALALFGYPLLSALMWCLYGSFAVASAVVTAVREGFSPFQLLMPLLFLIVHVCYGAGTLVGFAQLPFKLKKLREGKTRAERLFADNRRQTDDRR